MLGLHRMRERMRALQGQPADATIRSCRDLLDVARHRGDHAEEAELLNMISTYQGRLGDSQDAELLARQAVVAAERANDGRLLAEALTRLGMSMMDRRSGESGPRSINARSRSFAMPATGAARRAATSTSGSSISGSVRGQAAEDAFDDALQAARSAHAVDLAGLGGRSASASSTCGEDSATSRATGSRPRSSASPNRRTSPIVS